MSRPPHARSNLPASMPDLTAAILARTSGSACGRLRDLVCDLVDETLASDDVDLVRGHLVHCPACQGLVSRLQTARQILPSFAQVDPGAAFTAAVLIQARRTPSRPLQPPDPFTAGWARLMRRPRAAMEAAYLATAAGVFLTQIPVPGSHGPLGSVIVSRVRTETRESMAGGLSLGQAWAARVQALPPVRVLHPGGSGWSAFWSRLTQRLEGAYQALSKAARDARAWIWREPPPSTPPSIEPSTEPSGASARPAP